MQRPGFKTTEFWLAAISQLVAIALASGLWGETDAAYKALAFVAAALASLGYSVARGAVKKGQEISQGVTQAAMINQEASRRLPLPPD